MDLWINLSYLRYFGIVEGPEFLKYYVNNVPFLIFFLKECVSDKIPPISQFNVCFIKIRTKHSSNTLLSLVRIFMKQKLVRNLI